MGSILGTGSEYQLGSPPPKKKGKKPKKVVVLVGQSQRIITVGKRPLLTVYLAAGSQEQNDLILPYLIPICQMPSASQLEGQLRT